MNAFPEYVFFAVKVGSLHLKRRNTSLTFVAIILEVVCVNWVEAEKMKQYQRYKPHSRSPEDYPGMFGKICRYETANDEKLAKLLTTNTFGNIHNRLQRLTERSWSSHERFVTNAWSTFGRI